MGHDERIAREWMARWGFYTVIALIVVFVVGLFGAFAWVFGIAFGVISLNRPDQKSRGPVDYKDSGFMDP